MKKFSNVYRDQMIDQLKSEPLDLLIIGGGITGAGIVLDARTRGLRTGLVEMQDFASGTSSRSTKLIHGGLRYLKQLDIKVVAESGKERAIVYENGPHITTPEWMLLPFYKKGNFGPISTNIGLLIYDFLARVKKNERRKMLSPNEAIVREPLLQEEGLRGAGYYVEYKTDDARLTIEVIKKAVQYGAHALNYTKVIGFIYNNHHQVIGVEVEDQITRKVYKIYAKKIINATGPWVDIVRKKDEKNYETKLHITKGIHLVFSNKDFPLQQAIYFDGPDGRMIFAIPRNDKTYVGTTETDYSGNFQNPTVTKNDQDYLLQAIHFMFPSLQLTTNNIHSCWAGLRPLVKEEGKKSGEISRKDEIIISTSGLISIAGGKLTGYRKMAEKIVNIVVDQLQVEEGILYSKSQTIDLPIAGGEVGGSSGFEQFKKKALDHGSVLGINEEILLVLIHRYGTNIKYIFQLFQESKEEALHENIDPIVLAELKYSLDYELIYKPIDFFMRRTGSLYFHIDWVKNHQIPVIKYMAKVFNWSEIQQRNFANELKESFRNGSILSH